VRERGLGRCWQGHDGLGGTVIAADASHTHSLSDQLLIEIAAAARG
jgi:hypothetical protein